MAVLASPDLAERYRYRHGVELLDGVTVASRAEDWWTAWRQFFF